MSYLIKMLIKKGICRLLSFNGNLWGLEKGRGVFRGNAFHCDALIGHVPPSGDASVLSSRPLSQCRGIHFKKSHAVGILFLRSLVQVQAFNDSY